MCIRDRIKDVSSKVIISPPQLQQPKIMAVGKRVTVALEDDLIPNTTYTIDVYKRQVHSSILVAKYHIAY